MPTGHGSGCEYLFAVLAMMRDLLAGSVPHSAPMAKDGIGSYFRIVFYTVGA